MKKSSLALGLVCLKLSSSRLTIWGGRQFWDSMGGSIIIRDPGFFCFSALQSLTFDFHPHISTALSGALFTTYSLHYFLTFLHRHCVQAKLSFILKWRCFPYSLPTSLITHFNSVSLRVLVPNQNQEDDHFYTFLLGSSKKSNPSFVVKSSGRKKTHQWQCSQLQGYGTTYIYLL